VEEEHDKLASTSYFDIEKVARRYHLDSGTARRLLAEAREEFGNDEMMAELHALRALRRFAAEEQKKAS